MQVEGTHSEMSETGGKEKGSDESDSSRRGVTIGGVIFLLNNLLFGFDPNVDDETEFDYPYRVESIAQTYVLPVKQILSCGLNYAGFVRAIYVNFGPMGYYELNPNARRITEPAVFEAQLRDLFKTGKVINPYNNQVIWRMRTNLSSIVSSLPANNQIIGCLPRDCDIQEYMDFEDYIRAASDEQTYVFVVGEMDDEIRTHIDASVEVLNYFLEASECLSTVIPVMEKKYLGLLTHDSL